MKKNHIGLLAAAVVLIGWQVLAMAVNMTHILPSPVSTLVRLWELRESLFLSHLPATLVIIVLSMGLSIAIGLLLAILMDMFPTFEAMIYPTLVVIQTIPVMCISPLFVLWFGHSLWARLLAVVLSTFFTITINTFDGLKNTKREMKELMQTYGAGRVKIFLKLKVPTALPNFITSLKITGDRRCHCGMAGRLQRPGLFQQAHDDQAGRLGSIRLRIVAQYSGADWVVCDQVDRPQMDRMAQ